MSQKADFVHLALFIGFYAIKYIYWTLIGVKALLRWFSTTFDTIWRNRNFLSLRFFWPKKLVSCFLLKFEVFVKKLEVRGTNLAQGFVEIVQFLGRGLPPILTNDLPKDFWYKWVFEKLYEFKQCCFWVTLCVFLRGDTCFLRFSLRSKYTKVACCDRKSV